MEKKLCIIGLGYVGLPLAVSFSKKYNIVGLDVDKQRVDELNLAHDRTLEVSKEQLQSSLKNNIRFTYNIEDIIDCNIYILTVPTPIDKDKKPDLSLISNASKMVAGVISKGDIIIYESTVYPGATEEFCVPILEKYSKLSFNEDFYCGYSPERINPGDKDRTITKILKITSGSTPEIAREIDELYSTIITAGTYLAPSIKVAEAAKVIENAQRDINIAFVNELAIIFNKLGIDTNDVLEAAATKWNFLPFKPGLVGGHCIGVDPYYLTHKAESIGYNPEVILAGRRLNDNMSIHIANEVIKLIIKKEINVYEAKILVLGITFKENCPDIRNTKVVDLIEELEKNGCNIEVYDPWADKDEVQKTYDISLKEELDFKEYDGIVLAVPHNQFKELDFQDIGTTFIYDIKSICKFADKRL